MESRFRRLIGIKRRDKEVLELESRTSSRHSEFSQWSSPVSILRFQSGTPLGSRSIHEDNEDVLVRSVPYDTVSSGKAPVFTSEPVKGNGPVKVQAMRRLSSGELMSTIQDNRRTLDDILEGDYIVGGKEKFDSRGRSQSRIAPSTPALSTTISLPASPLSTTYSPDTPPSSSAVPDSEHLTDVHHTSTGYVRQGLGILSTPVSTPIAQSCQWGESFDLDANSRFSRASTATSPSIQVPEERNATITALWKAEYSRLSSMYGRGRLQNNTIRSGGENPTNWTFPTPPCRTPSRGPEVSLDSLPHPNVEKYNESLRRASNISAVSSFVRDDNSDASSNKRASLVSSFAASSSCTLQTTNTDHDAVTTREDIHKLIDQMRANYLRALELSSPPTPTSTHSTKKKRRPKRGPPSARNNLKPSPALNDRQTWHGDDVQGPDGLQETKSQRIISHPPTAFGRLSPIESSPPPREPRPINRLHRADSSTLGTVLARMKTEESSDSTPKSATEEVPRPNTSNRTIRLVDEQDRYPKSLPKITTTLPANNFF